ncbi:hypothetical protein ACTFIV_002781 [Dictyostelium citrinum]
MIQYSKVIVCLYVEVGVFKLFGVGINGFLSVYGNIYLLHDPLFEMSSNDEYQTFLRYFTQQKHQQNTTSRATKPEKKQPKQQQKQQDDDDFGNAFRYSGDEEMIDIKEHEKNRPEEEEGEEEKEEQPFQEENFQKQSVEEPYQSNIGEPNSRVPKESILTTTKTTTTTTTTLQLGKKIAIMITEFQKYQPLILPLLSYLFKIVIPITFIPITKLFKK